MKKQKALTKILFLVLVLVGLNGNTFAQETTANMSSTGSTIRWDVKTPYTTATLTISAPDGRTFTREFKGGSIDFILADSDGNRLPDGVYSYELRLTSSSKHTKQIRRPDDEPEALRSSRKHIADDSLVQSGSFSIVNGVTYVPGAIENNGRRAANEIKRNSTPAQSLAIVPGTRQHHVLRTTLFDQVIADDLIVQGSICAGLDCVNNENFGFDTIRVKENNTRIQFDDTSASAGFATNNWQIRANSSASGGASFLAFVDQGSTGNSETGTIVFEVDAGAPANSLKVSSNGNIGVGTATPVLDVHVNTTDTPAFRLEQNNSGGFTAQTWDVAGNEANFFVRDVTGGSRLPLRIRPGAPTSSIDINSAGSVGIGTASPNKSAVTQALTVNGSADAIYELAIGDVRKGTMYHNNTILSITNNVNGALTLGTNNTERFRVDGSGNVGIGTTGPTALLSVNGTANKPGGGSWDVFSDERLKNIKGRFNSGLGVVLKLQPLRYEYKKNNALGINSEGEHIGFGAQAVQKIIPEAVTMNANGYLQVNNDPIIWTMLNAIKEQQKQIEQLKGEVRRLRATSRRRR